MQLVTLPSGHEMPMVGIGTYEQLSNQRGRRIVGKDILALAFEVGYRHIDSASYYGNHREIGQAVSEANLERSEVFVTTKVYRDKLAYDEVLAECEKALQELGFDYLDLYLIHWPNNEIPMSETFRAMRHLIDEGLVRDVGVANFTHQRLARAVEVSEVPIAVNQVEYHPFLNQEELLAFCRDSDITVMAYAPIAQGQVMDEAVIRRIGEARTKSPVQVTLRWLLQKGIVPIPKGSSRAHLAQNLDVFDWELSTAEMSQIDRIERSARLFGWEILELDRKDFSGL